MTQTNNRIFDEMARLMNDAAGVAQGVRREFDTLFRAQAERMLRDLDVVSREEFEAVKEMAQLAREENEALKARIEALEAKSGEKTGTSRTEGRQGPQGRRRRRRHRAGGGLGRFRAKWEPARRPETRPNEEPLVPAFLALSGACRYNPADFRGPRHPWRHAAASYGRQKPPFSIGLEGYETMASVQEMKATVRPKGGKGAARSARRAGNVPGVIYGNNEPPVMVLIEHDELKKRIYQGHFLSTLYELNVDGKKHRVIPRDFQLDALKDLPMHVDFLRVAPGAKIRVNIPVHVLNTDQSPGVKRGGSVNVVNHSVMLECPVEVHSGFDRRRHRRPRDQPLPASQRSGTAGGRARDRPRGHDAGDHRGAVGLCGRAEGRSRSRRRPAAAAAGAGACRRGRGPRRAAGAARACAAEKK